MAARDIVEVTIVFRDGTEQNITGTDVAARAQAVIHLYEARFADIVPAGSVEPPPSDAFVSALDTYVEARLSMALGHELPSSYILKEREAREALNLMRTVLRAMIMVDMVDS